MLLVKRRGWPLWLALIAGVLILFLGCLLWGSVIISPDRLLPMVLGRGGDPVAVSIIWHLRFPKAIAAFGSGAALAVAGLQMQTLFRNVLAGPFVLGINAGASLGVAIVVLWLGQFPQFAASLGGQVSLIAAAWGGAFLALGAVLLLSQWVRQGTTLLILGLLLGYLTNAVVTVLLHFSSSDRLQSYVYWTFGSFGGLTLEQLPLFLGAIAGGLLVALLLAKPLNGLLLGEDYARSLGIPLERSRQGIILSTAILAGTVTAFCGPIAFIGVAVPHLARSLFHTADHRILLPGVMLLGSGLALIAAMLTQVPGQDWVLPLNAITSLLGVPLIALMLLRRSR